MIVKDDAFDAPMHCIECEHEIGKARQRLGPISTNSLFAAQDASRLSEFQFVFELMYNYI